MIALDTSVVVAALLSWHEHHDPCRVAVEQALAEEVIVPAPTLLESYAVLTRLPAPHRLAPAIALALLRDSFGPARIGTLPARGTWNLLAGAAAAGVAGGRTYDAHVLEAALHAGATVLLTVNDGDFRPIAGERIEIRNPVGSA